MWYYFLLYQLLALLVIPCAAVTLTQPDPTGLANAIRGGGEILLQFDATLVLTNSLVITKDTTLDASGHSVVLDAKLVGRHLVVTNAAAFKAIGVSFVNGSVIGAAGLRNSPGETVMGGSIYSNGGRIELIGCSFENNSAVGGAGSTLYISGTTSLLNVTIGDNNAIDGFGGSNTPSSPVAQGSSIFATNRLVKLTNSIVSCVSTQLNVWGPVVDGGHNISSDQSASFSSPSSRNGVDPLLQPVMNNGGETPTMALAPNSPAIDAGDNAACPPTDQRGVPRPLGAACDIGAFELAPVLTIQILSGGTPTLQYRFKASTGYSIFSSANLSTWNLIASPATDSSGSFIYEDSSAGSGPLRFYAVRPSPAP